jgi:hypothetical protein
MSFQISPTFAPAEIEYRQQRIKAEFPARGSAAARHGTARASGSAGNRTGRPNRLAALFRPRRRRLAGSSGSGPRQPLPSPHHFASS